MGSISLDWWWQRGLYVRHTALSMLNANEEQFLEGIGPPPLFSKYPYNKLGYRLCRMISTYRCYYPTKFAQSTHSSTSVGFIADKPSLQK
jgi:hypothetical protein